MSIPTPAFSNLHESYLPDTCLLLKQAMDGGKVQLTAVAHGDYPGARLPHNVLPELRTAGYWNATREQNWGLDWHRNEGIELTVLHGGKVGFAVRDAEFTLHPGDLTITRPWQEHRVGGPHLGASRLSWLILDMGVRHPNQSWIWPKWIALSPSEKKRMSSMLRKNDHPVWKADGAVMEGVRKIDRLAEGGVQRFDRTGMVLAVNELLLATLHLLERHDLVIDETRTSSQRAVETFLAALPGRVGETWTVDAMAEQCGIKRSQFTNLCHELRNCTPLAYLLQCRVETAARMLRERPGDSILDIALECGFSSSQHFSTAFRRMKGIAPREERRKST